MARSKSKSRSKTLRRKSGSKKRHSSGGSMPLPKEGRITVYGKATCPWCQKMKPHLMPGRDVYVELTPSTMPRFTRYIMPHIRGQTSIPIVFIGTKFIGGYSEYMNYLK